MILVVLFVLVHLSCLPVLHSTTQGNKSMPVCREEFSCPGLIPFKYPFYNVTDTRCGLIKVNCTSKGGETRIGGRSFKIKNWGEHNFNHGNHSLVIYNNTFDNLVRKNSCEVLMNNFTFPSPNPSLYSILMRPPFIALFKCTKNQTYAQRTDASYFKKHNYTSYNRCKDDNFYYNYLDGSTVPSGLPHTCQVMHLPVKLPGPGLDENNIFSLLSSDIHLMFKLSTSCEDCYEKGLRCTTKSAYDAQCSYAISEKKGRRQMVKILAITGSTLILIVSIGIFIIWRHFKSNPFSYVSSKNKTSTLEDISLSCGVSVFSYTELEDATTNFDPSNELGDGGFGAVYYGKLQDGREVAVKKLHEHNYNRVQQFRNEVEILTKLRHPNLVVLYGCTSRQSRELLLVYEYVPNGTVFDHLHGGQASTQTLLTWPIRLNIAIETARALVYLHASEIIHRDVKTSNILLDHNFCVKVADFGLSRLVPNNVSHVSTAPQGTPGYVDPQYHQRYQLTDKSDVYSFGVVLIELISSMVAVDLNRSQDEIGLANFALNRIQKCAVDQLIDPALGSDAHPEIKNMITSVAELAFQCLQYDSEMRPTMKEVLDVLTDIQAWRGTASYEYTKDFQSMNELDLSESNDAVILLKDFLQSPVSVTSEWQSNNSTSASNTLNNKEDGLS